MNTAPLPFCDECGAALPPHSTCCPVCQQPVALFPSPLPVQQPGQNTNVIDRSSLVLPSANEWLTRRYTVIEEIGKGGFGVVYLAKDRYEKNRLVAIKQINLAALSAQEMIEATDSYNREVTLLEKLRHPQLPGLYQHFTDAQHWYVVMEYINGETLEAYLKKARGGRLSARRVIEIGIALCDVLQYLHTQHPPVIFRDVKPGNIMHTAQHQLYLIDFGIARRYNPRKARDTGPLGSPGYAAPEQYGTQQTTPQTDIYGLGVTLQTLLSGKEPFELADDAAREQALSKAPLKLRSVLARMQEHDPRHRMNNVEEVKRALQTIQMEIESSRRRIQKVTTSLWRFVTNVSLWQLGLIAFFISTMWQSSMLLPCLALALSTISIGCLSELYGEVLWSTQPLSKEALGRMLWENAKNALPYIFVLMLFACALNASSETIWYMLYVLVLFGIACVCVGMNVYWLVKLAFSFRQRRKRVSLPPLEQFQYHPH